jgi:uncharacterized protein (TIGR03435 family)
MNADRFDIVAKTATPIEEEQMKHMLRNLLADRFRMTIHQETKDASVMALLVASPD